MKLDITVIDYGSGNLHSITKALQYLGARVILTEDNQNITSAAKVVLPGVGAFGECMNRLQKRGQAEKIIEFASSGKPVIGICLGCQMLLTQSEEFGNNKGLNLIPGKVSKIPHSSEHIPNMGWKKLENVTINKNKLIFPSVTDGKWGYFVHSYYTIPQDPLNQLATVKHGHNQIAAIIGNNNVFGFQFHPEKSGPPGLEMLKDFLEL